MNNKGFGTDLPSVNTQVEEHNIFHNEVMAIGPHISKEGDKVRMLSKPDFWVSSMQGKRQIPCAEDGELNMGVIQQASFFSHHKGSSD